MSQNDPCSNEKLEDYFKNYNYFAGKICVKDDNDFLYGYQILIGVVLLIPIGFAIWLILEAEKKKKIMTIFNKYILSETQTYCCLSVY